jgi:chromosome segregation ATPase
LRSCNTWSELTLYQVGFSDGDTLDVHLMDRDLSSDESEEWMAHLEVTEEKIELLQTQVDLKRAELEAAAEENESVAVRVAEIRSSINRLRQNMLTA